MGSRKANPPLPPFINGGDIDEGGEELLEIRLTEPAYPAMISSTMASAAATGFSAAAIGRPITM